MKQNKICSIKYLHQLSRKKSVIYVHKRNKFRGQLWFLGLKSLKVSIPNCWREYTASCMWIQNRSFPRDILSYDTVRGSSVVERFITCISKRHSFIFNRRKMATVTSIYFLKNKKSDCITLKFNHTILRTVF